MNLQIVANYLRLSLLLILTLFQGVFGLTAQPKILGLDAISPASICILGGTNLAFELTNHSSIEISFQIETPFGISPVVYQGEFNDVPFYHIPMHGSSFLSDEENPDTGNQVILKTWSTLNLLGVRDLLGGATAGSVNPNYRNGDWIIPDDLIDWNIERPRSIARLILGNEGSLVMPKMNPADDPDLHTILFQEATRYTPGHKVYDQGTVCQPAGGRFETVAEIKMMKTVGCDLVTMSVGSEMAYARQLGINYACMVGIVNPAEGLGEWDWDSLTELYPKFYKESVEIYLAAVTRIAAELSGKERVGDDLRLHPVIGDGKKH